MKRTLYSRLRRLACVMFSTLTAIAATGYAPFCLAQTGAATVSCHLGENCSSRLIDGTTVYTLKGPSATIQLSLIALKRFTQAAVAVTNTGPGDADLQPAAMSLVRDGRDEILPALSLKEVLKKEGSRDNTWGNFFDMGTSATKQETIQTEKRKVWWDGSTDNGSAQAKTTVVTVPDEEARAAARAKIAARDEARNHDLDSMRQSYLRANTMAPGTKLEGLVYFKPLHAGERVQVNVPMGGTTYQFPATVEADPE